MTLIRRRSFLTLALGAGCSTALRGAPAFRRETFTYKRVGDLEVKLDAYRPADDRVVPVIVWIHGGALIIGNRANIRAAHLERYTAAGFAVVSIDYRLAPETKLAGILEDVTDAFRWVRERGPEVLRIDPARLGVVGHSAGGYLTLMTGFAVKPRPRAIVAFYGYGDIDGPWYSRPDPFYLQRPTVARDAALQSVGNTAVAEPPIPNQRGRFYLYCRQSGRWPIEVTGHDPDKEPRAFDRFCPVRNVSREYPPTLLLHGDSDTDVPHAQSVQMAKELERAGVEHQLITIPGGPHGFDGQASDPVVARAFDRAVEFLQKHVAGAR